jgi:hypothetical protein
MTYLVGKSGDVPHPHLLMVHGKVGLADIRK